MTVVILLAITNVVIAFVFGVLLHISRIGVLTLNAVIA
jgi:hypothetical protein